MLIELDVYFGHNVEIADYYSLGDRFCRFGLSLRRIFAAIFRLGRGTFLISDCQLILIRLLDFSPDLDSQWLVYVLANRHFGKICKSMEGFILDVFAGFQGRLIQGFFIGIIKQTVLQLHPIIHVIFL